MQREPFYRKAAKGAKNFKNFVFFAVLAALGQITEDRLCGEKVFRDGYNGVNS
jgi:hypothetical protein